MQGKGYVEPPYGAKLENGGKGAGKSRGCSSLAIVCLIAVVIGVLAGAAVAAFVVIEANQEPGTVFPTTSPTPPTNQPTLSPTESPTTSAPTESPTTSAPTESPTTSAPTISPTVNPTTAPTPPTQAPTQAPTGSLFPNEFFDQEGDFVGLFFVEELGEVEKSAFTEAARKWSDIVSGTIVPPTIIEAGEDLCQNGLTFDDDIVFEHLGIFAFVGPIDGAGNILGQAGPCAISDPTVDPFFPILGTMEFDEVDIGDLLDDGSFKDVILHEMGHVLGIGTLWDLQGLLDDPVFPVINNQIFFNPAARPGFLGSTAITEYSTLTQATEQFVPVEDGLFFGEETFGPRAQGAGIGSIDGHWDESFLLGELMGPRLIPGAPLSRITFGALVDGGYTVNFALAGDFELPDFFGDPNARPSLRGVKKHDMVSDIKRIPIKIGKPVTRLP